MNNTSNITSENILIAEDIVARWLSLTRGMNTHQPSFFLSLRVGIIHILMNARGHSYKKAEDLTQTVIQGWANEVDGMSISHPAVTNVLEVRIAQVL